MKQRILVICSGGLDSVTLADRVAHEHTLERLLSFDYGQRHRVELDYAAQAATRLGVGHDIVDISGVAKLLPGSALTDDVEVPEGHYAADNMATTVVPNRNAIMLSIAFGVASAANCDAVGTAVHGGDHFIYPDCRPGFVTAFQAMQDEALEGMPCPSLFTPYLKADKTEIARDAGRFGTPIADTWSCYKGGTVHCGRCGTCVERIEALHLAGVTDPTTYTDPTYWRSVTKEDLA